MALLMTIGSAARLCRVDTGFVDTHRGGW